MSSFDDNHEHHIDAFIYAMMFEPHIEKKTKEEKMNFQQALDKIKELEQKVEWRDSCVETYRGFYDGDTKTICRLSTAKTDLEKRVKKLESDLVLEKGVVDLKDGAARILAEEVAKLEGEVKYWSELARLSTSAHQNAVAMIVRTAGMTDEVIDLWYKRSMYAKNIIWGLIDWFRSEPGAEKLAVSGKLPKWVRKEMWNEPD